MIRIVGEGCDSGLALCAYIILLCGEYTNSHAPDWKIVEEKKMDFMSTVVLTLSIRSRNILHDGMGIVMFFYIAISIIGWYWYH